MLFIMALYAAFGFYVCIKYNHGFLNCFWALLLRFNFMTPLTYLLFLGGKNSDKTLSKNELFELIQIFGEKFIIPAKKNQIAPKEASNYINFIILICSHQNADAKLISFLDKEAKKKNPSYVAEVEDSERIGIENRKNRR